MPKQIKIGFDKTPSPVTNQFPQLVDIEGNLLFDEAGNPLLTEEEGSLVSFARAENSTSVHLNNNQRDITEIVPINEIFPEQSAVSTNLLGYIRAETQLSLFSDVSTYGLDVKNWDYYTFTEGTQFPPEWYRKENPVFGRRTRPDFQEETREQALLLKSYPTQYSYPFGRSWIREGSSSRYNEQFFPQYLNFISMGKYLYQLFESIDPIFARKNLISSRINIVPDFDNDPDVFLATINPSFGSSADLYGILSMSAPDVNYGPDEEIAFDEIERWTSFWQQIVNGVAVFPPNVFNAIIDFTKDPRYVNDIQPFARTSTRPGYSDTRESFAILESKNSFRYQPGRASGFTFGTRLKTDTSSLNNFIEWGAANETDEYIFQLRGSQFNIIRRSVIPLPNSLLERMGIPESAVNNEYYSVTLDNGQPMQEVVISRDNWNGDKLNGSGPSGYTLQFENVTMYKIEFSWYGAIGAKFYTYVPADNGEARWVLMHTLIIENGMGQPILKNPNFKFRYLVYSDRTSSVNEPFFIYKYGSSYYIDGGDEGTVRLATETSDTKTFTTRTPVIGVLPKNNILSSFQATEVVNQKKILPTTVSVNATAPVRIDIEEIQGSGDGFHHHYSPGLEKARIGVTANVAFNSTGTQLRYANNDVLPVELNRAKVIANGVYNVYIGQNGNVERRSVDGTFGFVLQERAISDRTAMLNGTLFEPREGTEFQARFSKYTYAASNIPINSESFVIHFLNPRSRDGEISNKHFADFMFSFVEDAPYLNADEELVFGTTEESFEANNSFDDRLFVEWSCLEERINSSGREELEWDPSYGDRLEIDPRLKSTDNPLGVDGGRISAIIGEVQTFDISVDNVEIGTDDFSGLWKITFASSASVPTSLIRESLGTGEIGINGLPTGILFAGPTGPGDTREFIGQEGDPSKTFVYVDGNPGTPSAIQLRSLVIRSGWSLDSLDQNGNERFTRQQWIYNRIFSFNLLPLYLVVGMKDNARIHNIIVEEKFPAGSVTHTPVWVTDPNSGITVINSGGSNDTEAPSNFTSEKRLQGSLFDIQTTQPMRPGEVIYSFYANANEPLQVDLSDVFDFDRRNIATGLFNNKAIYFTANELTTGSGGNIEMTLTVKEQ